MIKTARKIMLILLALAIVAGPAMAQQKTTGAGATAGTAGKQTFAVGSQSFAINTINQVDASRLQEMGVQTVSVPAGTTVSVTYSTAMPPSTGMAEAPKNLIVFGPNGYAGAVAGAGGLSDKSVQPYTFTGTSGQYYVISQLTEGGSVRDMVLASFD